MGKEQLFKIVAQKAGKLAKQGKNPFAASSIAKGIKTSNDFVKNASKLEDLIVDVSKDNIFAKGCSSTCAKNIEKVCERFKLSDDPIEFLKAKAAIKTYSKIVKKW